MSELHSEFNDSLQGLTVRVKLVDLNHTSEAPNKPRKRTAAEHVSKECLSAIAGKGAHRNVRPLSAQESGANHHDESRVEICMLNGDRIPVLEFESHIENCSICANRVELQLDFMESLEVAVYQRRAEPDSKRVHGAMLISAPELNFAVCGEVEIY